MNRHDQRNLQRLLSGELDHDAGQALRDRLRDRLPDNDELRAEYESLEQTWSELDLPEPSAPPQGFAMTVSRAAQSNASGRVGWSMAPRWAQTAAAVALAGGVALGLGLASSLSAVNGEELVDDEWETTLAESYWLLLDETAADSSDGGDGS